MHRLFGDPKAHEIKRISNREEDEPVGRGGGEKTRERTAGGRADTSHVTIYVHPL
jgi:hypothetical protein